MNLRKELLTILCLSMSFNTEARMPIRGSSTNHKSQKSGKRKEKFSSVGREGITVADGATRNCKPNDTKGYLPQSFIRNITNPDVAESEIIKINQTSLGIYEVEIGEHISACTDLEINVEQVDNNYFVRVKNKYVFDASNVKLAIGEKLEKLSDDEKYYRCLEHEGMLKEDKSKGNGAREFDWNKARSSNNVNYSAKSRPFHVAIEDESKSINTYYASPVATEYPQNYPAEDVSPKPSDWQCMNYENVNEEGRTRLYISERDRVYEKAVEACNSKDAEKILAGLAELRESNAGNFRELERIMEQAFDKVQEERVDKIYDRMEVVAKELKNGKKLDRDEIVDLAEEYSDLAKEVKKIVIEPSVERIEGLLRKRKKADKKEKKKIDEQVKSLNEKISKFANDNPSAKKGTLSKVYDRLEDEGLVDEAKSIEDLRLSSHFYGRVYDKKGKMKEDDDRDKALTMKKAKSSIKSQLKKFDSGLDQWEERYAVKTGDKEPMERMTKSIMSRYTQMQNDYNTFQVNEYKYTQQYCGTNMIGSQNNPYQCKKWLAGQQQRQAQYKKIQSAHSSYINSATGSYLEYSLLYQDYVKDNASRDAKSSGSSFSFYGDTTTSNNPLSLNNFNMSGNQSTGLNSLFNMTGNNTGMSLFK